MQLAGSRMPRFFFHVFNGLGHIGDEEGQDLEDQAEARRTAIDSVRSMVAEDVRAGTIDLCGRIEVMDAEENVLVTVAYPEAFELRLPGTGGDRAQ